MKTHGICLHGIDRTADRCQRCEDLQRIADLERQVADLLAYNQTRTDELAASVAQVAALMKENERLQTACNRFSESEILEGNQLAASQAREEKLREGLHRIIGCHVEQGESMQHHALNVLALPADDTALQARLAEEHKAGYAAAIEAVKAGGVVTWMLGDDVYRVKQVRLFTHPPGQEIPGQIPLYKLPEDV